MYLERAPTHHVQRSRIAKAQTAETTHHGAKTMHAVRNILYQARHDRRVEGSPPTGVGGLRR